jgi:hypothetical protein
MIATMNNKYLAVRIHKRSCDAVAEGGSNLRA